MILLDIILLTHSLIEKYIPSLTYTNFSSIPKQSFKCLGLRLKITLLKLIPTYFKEVVIYSLNLQEQK